MTFNTYIKTKTLRSILELRKTYCALLRLPNNLELLNLRAAIQRLQDLRTSAPQTATTIIKKYEQQPKRITETQINLPGRSGVVVVSWPGQAYGVIALSLNFLVTFSFKRKSNKHAEEVRRSNLLKPLNR